MSQYLVEIDYTNWRGVRSLRIIDPIGIGFAKSEYHPEKQWMLFATDQDKGEMREFALRDIHAWRPVADGAAVSP